MARRVVLRVKAIARVVAGDWWACWDLNENVVGALLSIWDRRLFLPSGGLKFRFADGPSTTNQILIISENEWFHDFRMWTGGTPCLL